MNRCYFVSVQISTPDTVALGSERNILALFAIAQGKISSSEVSVKLNAEKNRDQVNRFILHICCPTLCLVSFQ